MSKITVIPSTLNPLTQKPISSISKRRVAAYARVSTDSDEQYTSYEAQVTYYKKHILERSDWEYAGLYADEGITGTNTKRRVQFNKMIEDALGGNIDLIITKSISRFARNVIDTLSITRKLKAKGVEVYFEKENLWTFDSNTELILSIMATIAQEESRSISENVTWGKKRGFENGKVTWAYKNFLGYEKKNGKIVINEDGETVLKIYKEFLVDGKTCSKIAMELNEKGIPTPSKKEGSLWTKNNIYSILTNEKYKGDALLQKTFTTDFLEHTHKKNEGEKDQFYVTNSHPAIIEKEMWELVQLELKRREKIGKSYSGNNVFSAKLLCEDCGGYYGKKLWHSTDKYKRSIYQCNKKFIKGKTKCQTPNLYEDEIKEKFLKAYNKIIDDKDIIIEDTKETMELLGDSSNIDKRLNEAIEEMEVARARADKLIEENKNAPQAQDEYEKKFKKLENEYKALSEEVSNLKLEKKIKEAQKIKLSAYIKSLEQAKKIDVWSDSVFRLLVDKAIVHRDGKITFIFFSGDKIKI